MVIGWILVGNQDVASARIMGWNVHQGFLDRGIDSRVLSYRKTRGTWSPTRLHVPEPLDSLKEKMKELDVLILQKVCFDNAIHALREAKAMGVKTVYVIDDLVLEGIPMAREADIVVAGSEFIQKCLLIEEIKSVAIIDAYESPRELCKQTYPDDPRVVWFGTMSNVHKALRLRWITNYLKYPYDLIGDPSMKGITIAWDRFTVWDEVLKRDIVVIPQIAPMLDEDKAKGNNRLTQAMVLGMPVIASPFPAYLPIIKQGVNGFIAYTESEWMDYLKILKDPKIREEMGKKAREDVIDKYSMEAVCQEWMRILQ